MSLFLAGMVVQAQDTEVVLTQNTDEVFTNNGVSCPGGDNWWIREYNMNESGITNGFVTNVEFAVMSLSFDEELEFYAFDYPGFPAGFDILNPPTAIASGTIEVGPADAGIKLRAAFDIPGAINADSNIIIAIVQPFQSGNQMFMAATGADTKESYLASENCGITEPDLVSNVGDGFPEAKHFINLVLDTSLSVNDVLSGNVAIYPNPTTDVFNVQLPSNVVVNSSSLVDVLGKTTGVVYSNGEMNVSALAPGVYFLKLDTNVGSYTQKVVKQ